MYPTRGEGCFRVYLQPFFLVGISACSQHDSKHVKLLQHYMVKQIYYFTPYTHMAFLFFFEKPFRSIAIGVIGYFLILTILNSKN
jgi:hypothetical protein